MNGSPRFLYVHVPFCVRRCAYCDFAVHATREPPVDAWLAAMATEMALLRQQRGWGEPLSLDTIYVGGGTPSLLGTGVMDRLGQLLSAHAEWDPTGVEWSCEANPESFTPELARDWHAAGVNRLSFGVQSFHEPALRWMGRLHGPDGPGGAVRAARGAGFRSVSLDLIFGLPERLGRSWADDLTRALALEPEHVSLYGLTAETGTPLGRWVGEGREALADEDRYVDEYLLAVKTLCAAGFEHYEVSNFARPGHRSRHNGAYWTGAPYAALGPGAHSFYPPLRRWNLRDWAAYRTALAQGELPVDGEEEVDQQGVALERVWLGLRTADGVPLDALTPGGRSLASRWATAGLAKVEAGRLRLSAEGWLVLDRLAVELASVEGDAQIASLAPTGSLPNAVHDL